MIFVGLDGGGTELGQYEVMLNRGPRRTIPNESNLRMRDDINRRRSLAVNTGILSGNTPGAF